jgi:hypothetical protein
MSRALVVDGAPRTTRRLEQADRFRYWRGRSGRRYLFSAMPADALGDLASVVVLMAAETAQGPSRIVWIGEIDAAGLRQGRTVGGAGIHRTRIFVHFLAETDADRQALIADLTDPS